MNLQQLEYITAVYSLRSFAKAANSCFVTQPTLSMMIQKLEGELDVILFDRKKTPITPTKAGLIIIERAQRIVQEAAALKDAAAEINGGLNGELKIGVIPTAAPFLLPLFIKQFAQKYSQIKLIISELTTELIIEKLVQGELDIGIAATPLNLHNIKETPLYKEELLVFASSDEKILKKKLICAKDIEADHLWLLEDGHCLRSQIMNLCELRNSCPQFLDIRYETGSIESLIKMVELNGGLTITPELATLSFTDSQKNRLRYFNQPAPVREISLITNLHFARKRIFEALETEIKTAVRQHLLPKRKQRIIEI